jgi:gamma-glutamyl-gamma-aminobutyrate hydrolase PuuD
MRKILVTQRVEYISSHDEHRDALDQRWILLMLAAKLFPVTVANNLLLVKHMLAHNQFDGLLLTGGNSLVDYGGDSVVRDKVEQYLFSWAIKHKLPVLGVCRGMQLIQHYFQSPLQPIPDHVGVKKHLHIVSADQISRKFGELGPVSVFHHLGAYTCHTPLMTVAKSTDDVVMAIRHESLPVHGVMWHPEREKKMIDKHIEYLRTIFYGAE